MGRELKRVPLGFNWPIDKVWQGYINPFYQYSTYCAGCNGTGYSATARHLQDLWYGQATFKPEDRGSKPFQPTDKIIMDFALRNLQSAPEFYGTSKQDWINEATRLCALFNKAWSHHLNTDDVASLLKADRLMDFTHTWSPKEGWKRKDPPVIPTPQQVNEWSLLGFGHDGSNAYYVIKAECERLGKSDTCDKCNGSGTIWDTPEHEKACDDWKREEPPTGPGYQLWETVSEGSPISPVFATPEELAEWLATSPDYTWKKNDRNTTKEQWLKFIVGPGWAPSIAAVGGEVKTGVEAVE